MQVRAGKKCCASLTTLEEKANEEDRECYHSFFVLLYRARSRGTATDSSHVPQTK